MLKKLFVALLLFVAVGVQQASAQYYAIANQATNMLTNIFTSGAAYRGFLDAAYTRGIGTYKADVLEFSTTQGAQLADWFYIGAGVGVDVLFTDDEENFRPRPGDFNDRSLKQSACMIPVFSDFRFDFGLGSSPSMFLDLRLGASFLVGKDYLQVGDGYISGSECFYLRPSLGCRFPLMKSNPKVALNLALTYQLITTEYYYGGNVALNSLGLKVGFEW